MLSDRSCLEGWLPRVGDESARGFKGSRSVFQVEIEMSRMMNEAEVLVEENKVGLRSES